MKDADDMLKQIIKSVDTSGDGKIQYEGGSHSAERSNFCGLLKPIELPRVSSFR